MLEDRFLRKIPLNGESREAVIKAIKKYLSERKDVVFAYLHGSFIEASEFRDIDVAVFTAQPVKEIEFESDLSYELTEKAGYPVEVRVINDAPVAFQMAALGKGKVILNRQDELRTDFIENIGRKYREYSHFRNLALKG